MVPYYLGPWVTQSPGVTAPGNAINQGPTQSPNTTLPTNATGIGISYMLPDISYYLKAMMIGLFVGTLLNTQLMNLRFPPRKARNWVFRIVAAKRTAAQCGFSNKKFFLAQTLLALYQIWQGLVFLVFPLILFDIIGILLITKLDKKRSRNFIFKYTGIRSRRRISKRRLLLAKSLPFMWYSWACAAYLVWPGLFIFHLVQSEMALDGISEAELLPAVGQWGPWVSVALALLGACINKLFAHGKDVIRLKGMGTEELDSTRESSRAIKNPIWLYFKHSGIVVIFVKGWRELKTWWKNPMEVSWESEPENKKESEDRLFLAWCRSEGAGVGYDVLLNRISDSERGLQQPWSNRLPVREREVDVAAQPSNAAAHWWPLNDHYENQSEDEDEKNSKVAK
jgi:hypothetical protein